MKPFMKCIGLSGIFLLVIAEWVMGVDMPISEATSECLECHQIIHPGIVAGWQKSRHAAITPAKAMAVKGLARKVSSDTVPAELQKTVVGCAECHTLRPDAHADTFDHNGHAVHVVVSPNDCATCHTQEASQYNMNLMAHAYKNLIDNAVYQQLTVSITGTIQRKDKRLSFAPANEATNADACLYCHGTKLAVTGTEVRDTELAGEMEFPKISGWPNQGVGRVNLDGSIGACSACHTRHSFSIEIARKPYTCKECHVGPDVPAYKVYASSKHGNIFSSQHKAWDFTAVPWTIGKDFTAPTCATCHVSLLVNADEEVVVERSHQMSNRLPWRIFGLIYAHPHPASPDTTPIRNSHGLALPTDFNGGVAQKYLIGKDEMKQRAETMQQVCLNCHGSTWVNGFWQRFENTIAETNAQTLTGTRIMQDIWKKGLARGIGQGQNPFDEDVERKWSLMWLYYGNTIRFSSAMAGGGDYGVFANGRYQLSHSIAELNDWFNLRSRLPARVTKP